MKQEGSIISKPLDPFKKNPLALIKPEGAKKSSSPEEPQPGPSGSGCQTNTTGESENDLINPEPHNSSLSLTHTVPPSALHALKPVATASVIFFSLWKFTPDI